MFIAIPSLDKNFTSTLFVPASHFEDLDAHPKKLVPYFQEHFPGVVPDLISEEDLKNQYKTNPHLPLISIKCTPYHYDSSVVILGDAAHAMVPFYGQGMNAGLEDVRVLYEHLDTHVPQVISSNEDRTKARAAALQAYTTERHPDAVTINDLALRNFKEMNHDVTSPLYRLRKTIEETLNDRFPGLEWATQYSRTLILHLPLLPHPVLGPHQLLLTPAPNDPNDHSDQKHRGENTRDYDARDRAGAQAATLLAAAAAATLLLFC
ncbi:hypothetical protein LTS18_004079 [Coniosporium uncinatum]|uniref:Uncharacterized protein n=1 Tax=Coniosporium uncinatum TaxID=93489 RepID=A0ACC3DSQ7_9PEZI|nr:hypothetical protein LTS18_004079 [Coniosporium uncinatum]